MNVKKCSCKCVLALAAIVICMSCKNAALEVSVITITKATGDKVTLTVELAKTEEEQRRGFMGRNNIPDGTGMLFVNDKDEIRRFWMKNTPAPLSIAYIDSSGKIRDIFDMTPFSLEDVTSTVSVRYALEVPQGWFYRAGVKKGDIVSFSQML